MGVAALPPVVTTEVVLVLAAAETTTAIATTKQCSTVAEATLAVLAMLKVAAKVLAKILATCSGKAECPSMKMGAAKLPGNKTCEGKSKFWRRRWLESHPFSHLFVVLLLAAYSAISACC
jgi:hypothetical protein